MAYFETTRSSPAARRFSIPAMLRQMHQLARQRRALSTLDRDQLADIGISQKEAQIEANRPFWDAPHHWR